MIALRRALSYPQMATLIASNKGRAVSVAVDDDLLSELSRYRWHIQKDGYAARTTSVAGHSRTFLMHRVVAGCEHRDGREVDHRNRNKLDNRRGNLRIVDRVTQMQNVGPNRGGSSRFRGVSWRRDNRRWVAFAQIAGTRVHLGFFDSEDEAGAVAAAYRVSRGSVAA